MKSRSVGSCMADAQIGRTLETEVLIVGAGFAGSVAGYLLKNAGKDVLAVELRDAHAKDKLCAGMMPEKLMRHFDSLYGEGSVEALSPLRLDETVSTVNGIEARSEDYMCALPRKRLDDFCLSRYLEAGGRLIDCVKLKSIDETRKTAVFHDLRAGGEVEVHYGMLVGADGAASAVRRILNGDRQRAVFALEGVVPLVRTEVVFEYALFVGGYCWYIPRGEDATVGVGIFSGIAKKADCEKWLAEFCEKLGVEMPPLRGALIPRVGDIALRAGEDAYLIGDAAGLVNDMGGGIHLAFMSAWHLADSVQSGSSYEEAMASMVDQLKHEEGKLVARYLRRCARILPD